MPFKYFKGCHKEGLICGLIDGFGGRTKARHSESLEGRVLITGRIGAAPRPYEHPRSGLEECTHNLAGNLSYAQSDQDRSNPKIYFNGGEESVCLCPLQ